MVVVDSSFQDNVAFNVLGTLIGQYSTRLSNERLCYMFYSPETTSNVLLTLVGPSSN